MKFILICMSLSCFNPYHIDSLTTIGNHCQIHIGHSYIDYDEGVTCEQLAQEITDKLSEDQSGVK